MRKLQQKAGQEFLVLPAAAAAMPVVVTGGWVVQSRPATFIERGIVPFCSVITSAASLTNTILIAGWRTDALCSRIDTYLSISHHPV